MNFETYKAQFDKSFSKVSSEDFISKMEDLGYEFEDINYSNSINSIHFSMSPNIVGQKPNISNLLSSFCSRLVGKKKESVNWKLSKSLVNVFEYGITLEDLDNEQKSIDFGHFKFQQFVFEEKKFKVEDSHIKFNFSLPDYLLEEFNPENEPNKEAA